MNRLTVAIGAALLLIFILLAWLAFHFHGSAVKASEQIKEQEKTLTQQSGLIATMQEQDARNRMLVAEQQKQNQQLRQQGETYQRKLRDALKSDKCGNAQAKSPRYSGSLWG
jgi:Spy/CpxP family protein refolding chaperone